jgi:hypothetical protein
MCSLSWSSSDFYLPDDATQADPSTILTRSDRQPIIVADPRLDIDCSSWARSALDGPGHRTLGARLFGQQDTWLSWHWRELTSSVLLALAILLGTVLLVRRRMRLSRRSTV